MFVGIYLMDSISKHRNKHVQDDEVITLLTNYYVTGVLNAGESTAKRM